MSHLSFTRLLKNDNSVIYNAINKNMLVERK